jgi:formate hydrogenlyase subunit 6/NADH:ubiquinone oxidoreductase subunit I
MKKILRQIHSFFYLVPRALRAFVQTPGTTRFPFEPTEFHAAYRGQVCAIPENCVGCGLCVRDCPANALALEKRSKESFTLRHFAERCAYCAQCEYSCKFNAIYLDNAYNRSVTEKEKLRIVLVDKRGESSG